MTSLPAPFSFLCLGRVIHRGMVQQCESLAPGHLANLSPPTLWQGDFVELSQGTKMVFPQVGYLLGS